MPIRNQNIKIIRDEKRRYAKSLKYPFIPERKDDLIVITQIGDRLDLLANTVYGFIVILLHPPYSQGVFSCN